MHYLPKLNYRYSELEPYIDAQTMEIHYTKHHRAYVDNLNQALSDNTKFKSLGVSELLQNLDKLPEEIRQTVLNNAGGHVNHSFFWEIMSPEEKSPEGKIKELLVSEFGSIEEFKQKFTQKAMTVFGSGWAFLVLDKDKNLQLKRQSFQNSPLMFGNTPLLGIDVWEHAYYLKYQNRRKDYIDAWWHVVNWKKVEENLLKAI